jgi:hypothetical protein
LRVQARVTLNQVQMAEVNRRPDLPEAVWFESRRHGRLFQHGEVAFLGFRRRHVADGLQAAGC